jgi:sugar transferase (PEP-CTERM/EpsH1 system associated)
LGLGVQRFIALSHHLENYLVEYAGIPRSKVVQIYNGVDQVRYRPPQPGRLTDEVVVGTVGRMKEVKNQTLLVSAFIDLMRRRPDLRDAIRLKLVGSGPLLAECQTMLDGARLTNRADIVGDSDRVPEELQSMDLFVLPSLAEGISNTILEAMATGLTVVATAVGGNPELVADGTTGTLVPAGDEAALSRVIERYIDDPKLRRLHAKRGRERVESHFSLDAMVRAYDDTYRFIAGRAGA